MTKENLGNDRTRVVTEGSDLVVERVFAAPRTLVWSVVTRAEYVPHWWGPHGTTARVMEMDVRPGGTWRWIANATPEGGGMPFRGEYLEVDPPERLVRTSRPEVELPDQPAGPPAVETVTLEELDGGTRMVHRGSFPSEAALRAALSAGMTIGVVEMYDRVDDLLGAMS